VTAGDTRGQKATLFEKFRTPTVYTLESNQISVLMPLRTPKY